MWSLKENLFTLFGLTEKRDDPRKDADKRGMKERFMRCLGAEYDQELLPLMDNFVANLVDPDTALDRFVPYLENQMGVNYVVSDDLATRRKLARWSSRITRIKGTRPSYEILLKLMGFTSVIITPQFVTSGFDRGILDDDNRVFDGGCAGCVNYSITLTGTLVITAEIRAWIRSVVIYCEPIDARLDEIYYNGTVISLGTILVKITDDGDLVVDNSGDPSTLVRLVNGDLVLSGPNAQRYRINERGDLIYS